MKKTGIILPHFGPSQLTEEVLNIINKDNGNVTLYYESAVQQYRPISFPYLNVTECLHFSGKLIGTTLFSLGYITKSLKKIDAYAFLYDLPWLNGFTDYMANIKLLRNPDLKLLTRSEDYAKMVRNYTNRECGVCTIEELINA